MNCQDATLSLGVYLLGALDATERAAVDAHLRDCRSCQRELAELASLPLMLEQLRLEDVEPVPAITPSDDLYDRVAARARDEQAGQERRLSRFQRLTAVAAAVVVLAGVAVGGVALAHHGSSSGPATVSATQGHVHMTVRLTSQTAGTALDVSVAGLPENEHCWLVAVGRDGSRDVAGQWDATYSGRAKVTGSTRIPLGQLSKLVLLGSDRQPIDQVAV
jgi:predicted anti-sigma-YlaC factor YlaD